MKEKQEAAKAAETPGKPAHLCVVCKSRMNEGAVKCVECDSYQDWRRFVGFSNTALALLIALVSSTTTVIVTLASLHKEPARPELIVQFVGASTEYRAPNPNGPENPEDLIAPATMQLRLVVTNTGSLPGMIGKVSFVVIDGEFREMLGVAFEESLVIPPGEIKEAVATMMFDAIRIESVDTAHLLPKKLIEVVGTEFPVERSPELPNARWYLVTHSSSSETDLIEIPLVVKWAEWDSSPPLVEPPIVAPTTSEISQQSSNKSGRGESSRPLERDGP